MLHNKSKGAGLETSSTVSIYKEIKNTMENNNFKSLTASELDIRFFDDLNKLEIVFNKAEGAKFVQPEAWESIGYANAITALMLGQYPVQADGIWLSEDVLNMSSEDRRKKLPESDNLGYMLGTAVLKALANKVISYRYAEQVSPTDFFRVAYDGWNALFVRRVEQQEADALEADYVTHNRNAYRIIGCLAKLAKYRDLGMNVRLTWFERMAPYFSGEEGFRVKAGLFNVGEIDTLREVVNRQIANAVAAKTVYKTGKHIDKETKEAEAEGVVREVTIKPVATADRSLIDPSHFLGKSVQFVTGNGSVVLPKVYVVGEKDDPAISMISIEALARTVVTQGLLVKVLDQVEEVKYTSKAPRAKRRNAPEQVTE
jgi:hypothetical protein